MAEKRKVVDFVDDADLDDPFQHLAWALTQWIPFGQMAEMPVPKPLTPFMSDFLCQLGIRYHPELAVLHKVPDPDVPGRAKFIDQEEYDALKARGNGDVKAGMADSAAHELLSKIDPGFSKRMESMTEEEREVERERMSGEASKSLNDLVELRHMLGVKDE